MMKTWKFMESRRPKLIRFFSYFSREPINPHVGTAREPLSEEEKKALLKALSLRPLLIFSNDMWIF